MLYEQVYILFMISWSNKAEWNYIIEAGNLQGI